MCQGRLGTDWGPGRRGETDRQEARAWTRAWLREGQGKQSGGPGTEGRSRAWPEGQGGQTSRAPGRECPGCTLTADTAYSVHRGMSRAS